MIMQIAWRNLWRNKRRSLIVLTSIVVGVIALVLNNGLGLGMIGQMLENQIKYHVSHIQIHKKGFNDNKQIEYVVPNSEQVDKLLKSQNIKSYSQRTMVYGLLSSASTSAGCSIIGIDPTKEQYITTINESIIKGKYFSGKSNEIVIGQKMAEKLNVKLGSKVVTIATNMNGDVANELFRVVGIYKSSTASFDKLHIYIPMQTAQKMLILGNNFMEYAIKIDDVNKVNEIKNRLETILGQQYEVLTYKELLPLMMNYLEVYKQVIYIVYLIVIIAVLFGVVNTMLMSIHDRIQEFGVLMAIGMKRYKIFLMVMNEALVLGLFGTVIGFGLGLLIAYPLSVYGIDLSVYSDGLSSFGVDSIIYLKLDPLSLSNLFILMPIATMLGAIYPAKKAINLQATDAMRYA